MIYVKYCYLTDFGLLTFVTLINTFQHLTNVYKDLQVL